MAAGAIRAGIGGWTFEPWRGVFYPKGLAQAKELDHASRQLTAIEINGTYYSTQSPKSFAKWAASTPHDFVFSVKASRFCTNRRVLSEAHEAIAKFMGQGLSELGDKLGPILWQFMATKKFDAADFGGFLELLPPTLDGRTLRHVIEVRHPSFLVPEFIDLARKAKVAVVIADSEKYPTVTDLTADFVYARLQAARDEEASGYSSVDLDHWATVAKTWSNGEDPFPETALAPAIPAPGRDVFVFMINGAKVRAPAAATSFLTRI